MTSTTFLIDGLNLYHSVVDAQNDLNGAQTKWLDISALCSSYLQLLDGNAQLKKIYYFTALAKHMERRDPGKVLRHQLYIDCLKANNIIVREGRFKKKIVECDGCCGQIKDLIRHEEKESDVAIAVQMIDCYLNNECDNMVLVSGDTDLVPAIEYLNKTWTGKKIYCLFPYKRKNKDLVKLVYDSFTIKPNQYAKYQYPNPIVLPNGNKIFKPSN